MKVSVDVSSEYKEPYAVIYIDTMTDEIQNIIEVFSIRETLIIALQKEEDMIVRSHHRMNFRWRGTFLM